MVVMGRWLLVLLVVAGAARADDAVAVVTWVRGAVQVTRAGCQQPEDVTKGSRLFRGDRIAATPGADASLLIEGALRDLSSRPDARWTAGEPWTASGQSATSRPAGPDFAMGNLGLGPALASRPAKADVTPVVAPLPVAASAEVYASLDRAALKAGLAKVQPRIAALYRDALKKHPKLRGKVSVSFEIGRKGGVTAVKILDSDTGVPRFDRQLAAIVRAAEFPATGSTTTVTYPFVFKPE